MARAITAGIHFITVFMTCKGGRWLPLVMVKLRRERGDWGLRPRREWYWRSRSCMGTVFKVTYYLW